MNGTSNVYFDKRKYLYCSSAWYMLYWEGWVSMIAIEIDSFQKEGNRDRISNGCNMLPLHHRAVQYLVMLCAS
jgi:hypothetical protein